MGITLTCYAKTATPNSANGLHHDSMPATQSGGSMKITIRLKDVYGRQTAYPVCDKAKLFSRMAGTTSLTHNMLCLIEQLGFIIEVEQRTL